MKIKYIYFPPFCLDEDLKKHLKKAKKGIRTGTIELNIDSRKLKIWIVDEWIKIISFLGEEDIKKIVKVNKW